MHLLVLSAFRPERRRHLLGALLVSMHLLVLSAFRHEKQILPASTFTPSQCTFWCSVLSDGTKALPVNGDAVASQCTFWCSVLSDGIKRMLSDYQ